jgi:hypothetical protein
LVKGKTFQEVQLRNRQSPTLEDRNFFGILVNEPWCTFDLRVTRQKEMDGFDLSERGVYDYPPKLLAEPAAFSQSELGREKYWAFRALVLVEWGLAIAPKAFNHIRLGAVTGRVRLPEFSWCWRDTRAQLIILWLRHLSDCVNSYGRIYRHKFST